MKNLNIIKKFEVYILCFIIKTDKPNFEDPLNENALNKGGLSLLIYRLLDKFIAKEVGALIL
ncbi:hypothetical protein GI584_05745 [Gracilibacillus salitolerans]|uniref:Uncharacterized protein n=1 Tax=Gracilibacillus salitolerans TaxID=2663022 RepID=A0A5Q2TFH8_9BACI|nr:hypothetical protein GI584_05745 [Gracilibacillus salitolerans]